MSLSPIQLQCPKCNSLLTATPDQAGTKITCRRCDNQVLIPTGIGTQSSESLVDDLLDFASPPTSQPTSATASVESDAPAESPTAANVTDLEGVDSLGIDSSGNAPQGKDSRKENSQVADSDGADSDAADSDIFDLDLDNLPLPQETENTPKDAPSQEPASASPIDLGSPDDANDEEWLLPPESPDSELPSLTDAEDPFAMDPDAGLRIEGITPAENSFFVRCELCLTTVDVTARQIGEQLRCPDCHSMIEVVAPKTTNESEPPADDDELRLGPVVERTVERDPTLMLDDVEQDQREQFEKKKNKLKSLSAEKDDTLSFSLKSYDMAPDNVKETASFQAPKRPESKTSPSQPSVGLPPMAEDALQPLRPVVMDDLQLAAEETDDKPTSPKKEEAPTTDDESSFSLPSEPCHDLEHPFQDISQEFWIGTRRLLNAETFVRWVIGSILLALVYLLFGVGVTWLYTSQDDLETMVTFWNMGSPGFGGFASLQLQSYTVVAELPSSFDLFMEQATIWTFLGVGVTGVAIFVLIGTLLYVISVGQTICERSMNGVQRIDRYPEFSLVDFAGRNLYFSVCFWLACLPGIFFAGLVGAFGTSNPPVLVGCMLLSMALLVPVLLAAVVHNESPWMLYSPQVLKTFSTHRNRWLRFWILSIGIAAVLGVAAYGLFHMWWLTAIIAGLQYAILLVYFSLLGSHSGKILSGVDSEPDA